MCLQCDKNSPEYDPDNDCMYGQFDFRPNVEPSWAKQSGTCVRGLPQFWMGFNFLSEHIHHRQSFMKEVSTLNDLSIDEIEKRIDELTKEFKEKRDTMDYYYSIDTEDAEQDLREFIGKEKWAEFNLLVRKFFFKKYGFFLATGTRDFEYARGLLVWPVETVVDEFGEHKSNRIDDYTKDEIFKGLYERCAIRTRLGW